MMKKNLEVLADRFELDVDPSREPTNLEAQQEPLPYLPEKIGTLLFF